MTLAASITSNSTTSPSPTLRRNFLGLFFLIAVWGDGLSIKPRHIILVAFKYKSGSSYLMNKYIFFGIVPAKNKSSWRKLIILKVESETAEPWQSCVLYWNAPAALNQLKLEDACRQWCRNITCLWSRSHYVHWTTSPCLGPGWLQQQVAHD